jgi:uncharacterized protein involved in outer membrane biogenesis
MKRSLAIVLGLVTFDAVLGLLAAWAFIHIDWNRVKPWLANTVGTAIGREVMINGALDVAWMRDRQLDGWHALIPYASVRAGNVVVGNPAWAQQPVFGSAERVEFDLSLLPLLARSVSVPVVRFVAPDIRLERLADGSDNWHFTPDTPTLPWHLDVGSVRFDKGYVGIIDRQKSLEARVQVDTLQRPIPFNELLAQQEESARRDAIARVGAAGATQFSERARAQDGSAWDKAEYFQQYAYTFTVEGKLRGHPVDGHGELASVLALKNSYAPFPMHADVRVGDTRIAFIGTLTDPTDLDALDLRLWLSGKSLGQLYDVLRLTMPESPPYATTGHLRGRFGAHSKELHYEDFVARVGQSDLVGDLRYVTRTPRPLLSGKIESQHLQFRDLAPMIGARSVAESAEATAPLLPSTPMRPERWRIMDADVQFSGDHVFLDSELPIHQVSTRIAMTDAVLSLQPLRFRFAYGDVDAKLRFDGRSLPIHGAFDLDATNVQLKEFFAKTNPADLDLGTARATAKLTASGDSIGGLLRAANGELSAELDSGTISKLLIETAGLNLPNILIAKLIGDKPVKIDCAAADFVAKSGVFDAEQFIIDTDIARFDVSGHVDLTDEKLDLVIRPQTKSVRILSLRAPIHVTGPMRHPDVAVDKAVLLARSAGALGLGVIAAPLAAVPLTNTGLGKSGNHCAAIAKEAQKKSP